MQLSVTIGYGAWVWRVVEFPVSPLTCIVTLTTLALPCEFVIWLLLIIFWETRFIWLVNVSY